VTQEPGAAASLAPASRTYDAATSAIGLVAAALLLERRLC